MTDQKTASSATPAQRLFDICKVIDEHAPGITSDEYKAFLYVAQNEGATVSDVKNTLEVPQSSASRMLQNLNGSGFGLIEADVREDCRRFRVMRISPKGRQMLARLAILLGCFGGISTGTMTAFDLMRDDPQQASATRYDPCQDGHTFFCNQS